VHAHLQKQTRNKAQVKMTSRRKNLPQLLLIEDDASVRRDLQLLLQGKGYQVISFADVGPALADPESVEATHIVVDYSVPHCDGIEALRILKARGWQGVAVLITASYSEALRERAIAAGFVQVLAKPFRDDALLEDLVGVAEEAS
jgi:CheY-like chemotaxis protein